MSKHLDNTKYSHPEAILPIHANKWFKCKTCVFWITRFLIKIKKLINTSEKHTNLNISTTLKKQNKNRTSYQHFNHLNAMRIALT